MNRSLATRLLRLEQAHSPDECTVLVIHSIESAGRAGTFDPPALVAVVDICNGRSTKRAPNEAERLVVARKSLPLSPETSA